ncbi:MAG: hypothetical protein UMV23_02505, partial [Halanaerobium sp.]|nr:hypothetical protein [Halanaerobium sp.]
MRWKITSRFLLAMVLIVMGALLFNLLAVGYLIINGRFNDFYYPGNPLYREDTPIAFVRGFDRHLKYNPADNLLSLTEEGKQELQEREGWLQVLDEDGDEVFNYHRPEDAPEHYSPVNIVHAHLNSGIINNSSIFISEYTAGDRKYSYLIGFPARYITKAIFYYHPAGLPEALRYNFFLFLLIDGVLVIVIGYLFSRRLARPVERVVNSIQELSQGNYDLRLQEKGLYQNVYSNLNGLARTLFRNERERKSSEKHREEWIANIS